MYYFHFYVDDDKKNSSPRKDRLERLQQLASDYSCDCDIEDNEGYSTVRVVTPSEKDAKLFKLAAEPALAEGHY